MAWPPCGQAAERVSCKQRGIADFSLRCRLFRVLVEPTLNYCAEVWAPDLMRARALTRGARIDNPTHPSASRAMAVQRAPGGVPPALPNEARLWARPKPQPHPHATQARPPLCVAAFL